MQPSRITPLSVLSRYLIRQFFAVFIPVLMAFILLYVIVDFFERLGLLLRHQASAGAACRYFLFKIPLMVTQITPPAVVTAVLLSLGMLSRNNEITALRATGVTLTQTALPLIVLTATMSVGVLAWNESVVPYCTRQFQYVNVVEIRKQELRGILSDREIWYHGKNGFYNINHVDKDEQAIYGLVIYALDGQFHLERVIDVPKAQWVDGRWLTTGAVTRDVGSGDFTAEPLGPEDLGIPESMADFLEVKRNPEELSYLVLRDWVANLTRKGIDASRYLVDLHMKLAVPFASVILTVVAIPIAGGVRRHPNIATIVATGMAIGFAYWVVLALANSLGHSGTIHPFVAAWSANLIFALVGLALFLYTD